MSSSRKQNLTDQFKLLGVLLFCTFVEKTDQKELAMTANQIAYWGLQEQKRSNLANEEIRRKEARTHAIRAGFQNATDTVNTVVNGATKIAGLFV